MIEEELFHQRLLSFLEEDVYPLDLTGRAFRGTRAVMEIRAKENFRLAGNRFITYSLSRLGLEVTSYRDDGSEVERGDIILTLRGDGGDLLAVERTTLNLLSHLSGIATATREMVTSAREACRSVRIAATRKTLPGLRDMEKYAVEMGGGDPHRLGLFDTILIKDNHIALAGSVKRAISLVREKASFTKKLEIEVSSVAEAMEAYNEGVDAILIDNMPPEGVREILDILRGRVTLEISGRITPHNVRDYASLCPDIISSGYITHSARSVDMSADLRRSNDF